MSEVAELKKLQAEAKQLGSALEKVAKIKLTSGGGLMALADVLAKLPPSDEWGKAVAEFRERATSVVGSLLRERREAFRRIEAEYVRSQQAAGKPTEEFDAGWRIGPVYLQVRQESAEARGLYNREEVVKWRPVSSAEDLAKVEADTLAALEKWRLPDDVLVECFHEAVVEAARRRGQSSGSVSAVPIREWLAEVRLALVRRDLQGSKFNRKLKYAEFPAFGMLYNIDLYRAMGSSVPQSKRVGFETGSQAEQSRNVGVVTNGLRPAEPYKVYCYATPPRGGRAS